MATPVLVVTPSPNFGESVRAALEQTESYRVLVVSNKVPAIVRAEEESCRLAILDLDLGEQWVEEIGQSLRTIMPDTKLFLLAGDDELPPLLDSIRPWTLLRKPFQLATALVALARPAGADEAAPPIPQTKPHGELPWLTDVDTAAQHLTRLTLESSSQAALITRDNEVWAYAGELSQPAAQEIAAVMSRNWNSESDGDLLRFARLEATRAEHILYATRLAPGMLLGLVFDAETPFGTIRSQAGKLSSLLEKDDAAAETEVVTTPKLTWTPVSIPDEPERTREPEAATALEPRAEAAPAPEEVADSENAAALAPALDADELEMHEDLDEEDIPIPEIQNILRDVPSPEPERKPESAPPIDPDATRRTVLPRAVGAAPLVCAGKRLGTARVLQEEAQKGKFEKLLTKFKERLKDEVKDERLSGRLTDSASCLVADEGGLDPQMEKLLKSMCQDVPPQKRILEINPSPPVFETMNSMLTSGADDQVQEYIDLLYNQSLLLEGSKLKDPAAFARSVAKLMTGSGKGKEAA